jgi:transcriptional regulator with XRE-family HTH domain
MKITQLLREKLGLTQENLAQYLQITQSLLALYETGRRDLPAQVHIKIAEIFLLTEQKNVPMDSELMLKQESKTNEVLEALAKELEYKQMKEQRVLEKLKKKYDQCVALYFLGQHLQTINKVQSEQFLQLAIDGIEKNGLAHQTTQVFKLQSIKSQLEHINLIKKL